MSGGSGNINININANNEGLKKGLVEASETVQTEGKKMAAAATRASEAITKGMDAAGKSNASLRTQMRQATNDAQKMAATYGETSTQFITAAREAAHLRDQFGDVNTIINAMQPDAPFKALSGVVQGAAGGIAAITGAMGLFGEQSESTKEMLLKVQSALALSQGIDAVVGLKDAFAALNVVILANPLVAGAVVVAIAAATAAYIGYQSSITDAEKAQTALNSAQTAANKSSQEELTHLNNLLAIARDASIATKTRQNAVDELNAKYPEYLNNLSLENINTDKASGAIDKQTDAIKRRAYARAVENKMVELNQKLIERQQDLKDAQSGNGASLMDQVKGFFTGGGSMNIVDDIKSLTAQIDILSGSIKGNADAYVDVKYTADEAKKAEEAAAKAAKDRVAAAKSAAKAAKEDAKNTGWKQEVITTPTRGGGPIGNPAPIRSFTNDLSALQNQLPKYETQVRQVTLAWQEHAAALQMNIGLNTLVADSISTVATSIGSALAGAHVTMAGILEGIMGIMANFMKSLGESMIAAGTAGLAAKLLLANPVAAIAAGVALVALAGVVTTKLAKGPSGGGSGGGGSHSMGTNTWNGGTMNLGYKGPNGQGRSGSSEFTLSAVLANDKIVLGNRAAMRKMGRQGITQKVR